MPSLLAVTAAVHPPLEPEFIPAVLANRAYRRAVADAGTAAVPLALALERESSCVHRSDLQLLPVGGKHDADTLRYVERHVKFLLWAYGGWRLVLCGPPALTRQLASIYSSSGSRAFDGELMHKVYGRPFTVDIVAEPDQVPAERSQASPLGGHFDGCRIGFDLGASDYKLAAVRDGEAVFSTEIPWHPVVQSDPNYHLQRIREGLQLAASHLPRVDAIGGSSAGIYINNRVKVASLFRSVPAQLFASCVEPMFEQIQKEWNVPLVVVNDGDVTALAGAVSLGKNAMLGIAMGSSEAVGFLAGDGGITGQLNELAFAPVDFNSSAARDEWSGDVGVGALYFSQQAVNKLAPRAGFNFPEEMLLPERLLAIQEQADRGNHAAEQIFASIGVYLGYTLAHYADYYSYENLLLLGRVTSGRGGQIILNQAQTLLQEQFPELAATFELCVPDEKSRRVGQAVAAASLPQL